MPITATSIATPLALPNLPTNQTAQQLDTGEMFIVEVTSMPLDQPEASQWVGLKFRAWQVDAAGAPLGVEIPPFTQTVPLAGLADGTVVLDDILAQNQATAAGFFRNLLAARATLQSIPSAVA